MDRGLAFLSKRALEVYEGYKMSGSLYLLLGQITGRLAHKAVHRTTLRIVRTAGVLFS